MNVVLPVLLSLVGLIMGSFAGAQVWRLRARQLAQDKADGEEYDEQEYKRLAGLRGQRTSQDRSRCLSCGHTLAWYDLVPLVSWIGTKGCCRYCRAPIGRFEPLMELGAAGLFGLFSFVWVSLYGFDPASLGVLALWLVVIVLFVILFAYDLKWFLLPDVVMFPLIGLSVVISGLTIWLLQEARPFDASLSVIASVAILSGLYFILWLASKGMWVGFGDVKLGIALGVLLIDWKLAILALFLANLIGTLIVLPGLASGKLSRKTQIPFGPLLIVGFFIAFLAGQPIIQGYQSFTAWLSMTMLML